MADHNPNLENARSRLRQAQAEVDAQANRILRMRQGGLSSVEAEKTLVELAEARDEVAAQIRAIDPRRT